MRDLGKFFQQKLTLPSQNIAAFLTDRMGDDFDPYRHLKIWQGKEDMLEELVTSFSEFSSAASPLILKEKLTLMYC